MFIFQAIMCKSVLLRHLALMTRIEGMAMYGCDSGGVRLSDCILNADLRDMIYSIRVCFQKGIEGVGIMVPDTQLRALDKKFSAAHRCAHSCVYV